MAKKLSTVIGVDIGSRKIKVAELRAQGREPMISALGMIDTPEGAVDHTGVYNAEAVGIALKQAITQSGASVSHVSFLLPANLRFWCGRSKFRA